MAKPKVELVGTDQHGARTFRVLVRAEVKEEARHQEADWQETIVTHETPVMKGSVIVRSTKETVTIRELVRQGRDIPERIVSPAAYRDFTFGADVDEQTARREIAAILEAEG